MDTCAVVKLANCDELNAFNKLADRARSDCVLKAARPDVVMAVSWVLDNAEAAEEFKPAACEVLNAPI